MERYEDNDYSVKLSYATVSPIMFADYRVTAIYYSMTSLVSDQIPSTKLGGTSSQGYHFLELSCKLVIHKSQFQTMVS